MKITVETRVQADLETVWSTWNDPQDIRRWNAASDAWHTTRCSVDLREGGSFRSRMEAKDGSLGFDFEGTYTRVTPRERIDYRMPDGRCVSVEFSEGDGGVCVRETFDTDSVMDVAHQRRGWQAILDSFARYAEAKAPRR